MYFESVIAPHIFTKYVINVPTFSQDKSTEFVCVFPNFSWVNMGQKLTMDFCYGL